MSPSFSPTIPGHRVSHKAVVGERSGHDRHMDRRLESIAVRDWRAVVADYRDRTGERITVTRAKIEHRNAVAKLRNALGGGA